MSRNYANYSQYLGAQRCCDSRGPGLLDLGALSHEE